MEIKTESIEKLFKKITAEKIREINGQTDTRHLNLHRQEQRSFHYMLFLRYQNPEAKRRDNTRTCKRKTPTHITVTPHLQEKFSELGKDGAAYLKTPKARGCPLR